MALSARSGLAVTGSTGDTLAAVDFNQGANHRLAISRFLANRLGGEGIYSGGATVIGDITSGTDYPAFEAIVFDDSGQAWIFRATSATAMTFNVTSGACTAYLVIGQVSGVSPAMATGGATDFSIIVQLTATAAPAHSIALGAGSVTASAFTTWTPAGIQVASHDEIDGGGDHAVTFMLADMADDREYTFPDFGGDADVALTGGLVDISSTSTITGWSSYTVQKIYYRKVDKQVRVYWALAGTSNSATTEFTVPFTAITGTLNTFTGATVNNTDNNVLQTTAGRARIDAGGSTIRCFKDCGTTGWTASSTKATYGQLTFEIA